MGSEFAALLKQSREAAKLSQNALGRATDINPGTINRMETGEREPTGRDQVLSLAAGIGLDAEHTDRFVAAAGYAPAAYDVAGLANPTLIRMAGYLGETHPEEDRQALLRLLTMASAGPLDPALRAVIELWQEAKLSDDDRRDLQLCVTLAVRRWRKVPLPR